MRPDYRECAPDTGTHSGVRQPDSESAWRARSAIPTVTIPRQVGACATANDFSFHTPIVIPSAEARQ